MHQHLKSKEFSESLLVMEKGFQQRMEIAVFKNSTAKLPVFSMTGVFARDILLLNPATALLKNSTGLSPFQTMLSYLVVERDAIDSQSLGRSCDVPILIVQNFQNVRPLGLSQ